MYKKDAMQNTLYAIIAIWLYSCDNLVYVATLEVNCELSCQKEFGMLLRDADVHRLPSSVLRLIA